MKLTPLIGMSLKKTETDYLAEGSRHLRSQPNRPIQMYGQFITKPVSQCKCMWHFIKIMIQPESPLKDF